METHTFNGVLYDVVPAPYSMSINKCTGCALANNKHRGLLCPITTCSGFVRPDHSDKILTNPRNPHGN